MVELELVLVAAALFGAVLNVTKGYTSHDRPFEPRLFLGGLIAASIASLAAVSLFDVSNLGGYLPVIVLGILTGFGADVAASFTKKQKETIQTNLFYTIVT